MLDVDIDLVARERGPQQRRFAPCRRVLREGQGRTRRLQHRQVRLPGAVGKHPVIGEKQAGEWRGAAARLVVQELRRVTRDVIDDDVGHDVGACGERGDVFPGAEPRIDLRVIDRVESGVRAVDRMEERQHVDAAERSGERTLEQPLQVAERAAREAVGVGDQLRLVLHRAAGNAICRESRLTTVSHSRVIAIRRARKPWLEQPFPVLVAGRRRRGPRRADGKPCRRSIRANYRQTG